MEKIEKITAIITDLDNTLWDGTLAEKEELMLNKDYFAFLMSCYKKGMQLFVVSKNDEKEVLAFFKRLEIPKEAFTAIIANWEPKYLNIQNLITQTQLRPETVVFIDDNPLERTEVKKAIKDIHCIDAPDWKTLATIGAIAEKQEQDETELRERINRYRTAIHAFESKKLYKKEDKDFLLSLKREIKLGEISPENLDRFTRLLIVTHRINFNPDKFHDYDETLDYLHERYNKGDKLFAVSTLEGGVSLGLTGAFVVHVNKTKATIPDATFSCGIIGRDFEQKSLIELIGQLRDSGISEIDIHVKLTSTNQRVKNILEELGFFVADKDGSVEVYRIQTDSFYPKNDYNWIGVLPGAPEMEYNGFPHVIEFFEKKVKPLLREKSKIMNLGSAKSEVLGHLRKDKRDDFYEYIQRMRIQLTKIDLEYIPEEDNVVANAEDLRNVVTDASQDLVMAIELLEHTEHFWNVLNEMVRICKKEGHLFITVPSFNFPKHEYPIDLWRIGPKTLQSFFPEPYFKIINFEVEGNPSGPRGCMILVQKIEQETPKIILPETGKINWENGITYFP